MAGSSFEKGSERGSGLSWMALVTVGGNFKSDWFLEEIEKWNGSLLEYFVIFWLIFLFEKDFDFSLMVKDETELWINVVFGMLVFFLKSFEGLMTDR